MGTDVAELGQHALAVVLVLEQLAEDGFEGFLGIVSLEIRHAREPDDDKDDDNNGADEDVGLDEHAEVVILQNVELLEWHVETVQRVRRADL